MGFLRRHARDMGMIALVLGLFSAVNLLPPDTALQQVQKQGVLRVCTPQSYPPFVTGTAAAPGIEIELLQSVAARLGVRAAFNTNAAIGRDMNPAAWKLNRASCSIIIGGLVDSTTMRTFLDMSAPYLQSGWVSLVRDPAQTVEGARVGVFVGSLGRDRLELSRALRENGAATIVGQPQLAGAIAALRQGQLDMVVTDAILAAGLGDQPDLTVSLVPNVRRDSIAMGFWKGDLTLKRAISAALRDMQDSGEIDAIAERYGYAPLPEDAT
ncbi:extracellular solute-binding protein [Ketogulonicigenium robustum]|uniref:Extracellular solute-binding protein n=1 Tax=Ketogulonicigenium robustum TaxID=92947 RepID=A0A1W6NYL2_9RHOB|nr:transporter substrate-binding domain-containing protein [Ketogulonicigenium robustum]ARO14243.1 extracellular solute-binding protein [Ketogulonicigenium robustum]